MMMKRLPAGKAAALSTEFLGVLAVISLGLVAVSATVVVMFANLRAQNLVNQVDALASNIRSLHVNAGVSGYAGLDNGRVIEFGLVPPGFEVSGSDITSSVWGSSVTTGDTNDSGFFIEITDLTGDGCLEVVRFATAQEAETTQVTAVRTQAGDGTALDDTGTQNCGNYGTAVGGRSNSLAITACGVDTTRTMTDVLICYR